jgi:hypothetical protein
MQDTSDLRVFSIMDDITESGGNPLLRTLKEYNTQGDYYMWGGTTNYIRS